METSFLGDSPGSGQTTQETKNVKPQPPRRKRHLKSMPA
jgi:hypothetical protein